ncbi:hypothetical protein IWW47_005368 [Coemansia sp. RSA 2052]|nr:hypothetical protein IWW47_005368 [Coemansia sp. RSA 2052]
MPSPPNTSSRASLGSPDKPAGMPPNLSLPPGSEERTMVDFKRDYSSPAPLHNSGSSSAAAVDNIDKSPMPRPHRPARGGVGSRAYDAGDSMMEMFTPERDKHRPPPAQPLKLASTSIDNGQSSSLAHTLAAQLLERQGGRAAANAEKHAAGADRISVATHRPFVSFVASSSSDQLPGPLEPPGQARSRHTQATPALDANSKSSAPISREPVVDRAAATVGLPSPTDCLPPAPKRPCRADAQPAAAPSTTALSGLGDIGSSVLHNLLADALTPLREQLRGEIRNLHLDMIRQGFVYQEQVRALRQECGEARELRQELEKLRRENEQLRRHVPFFSMASDHANDSALAD